MKKLFCFHKWEFFDFWYEWSGVERIEECSKCHKQRLILWNDKPKWWYELYDVPRDYRIDKENLK